jgi:outer membrane protein assembly factor BamB
MRVVNSLALLGLCLACPLAAEDWPEWRGKARAGVWNERGILAALPARGLEVKWRVPVRGGFSGPAVAAGRIFLSDFTYTKRPRGVERAVAFDERTGRLLWQREWAVDYTGLATTYATGPRATPTVDGERVYFFGATGVIECLRAADGRLLWRHDLVKDFGAEVPVWGMSAAPLVDGPRLIVLAAAAGNSKLMAFDKLTGAVRWRSLSSSFEPGYSAPILIEAGGTRQLIQWHPQGVASLQPETGERHWEVPFNSRMGSSVATPVWSGARLMITSFFDGSMMLALDPARPAARMLWRGKSDSETRPDGLHGLIASPVIDGDYIYGMCSYGHLRCLRSATGEQVWETLEVTRERARWAAAHIVRNGERYFINNDRGELIMARLSPAGYQEIGRTPLIEPTSEPGIRREAGLVNWTHPAYANRHIITRNDKELLRASLAAPR